MNFNDYCGQGFAAFQKKDFNSALENFKAAYNINPNPEIQGLISMIESAIHFQEQELQAAANEAKQRAEIMGIQVEDVDQAIVKYTETLKNNPNDDSAKNNLASAYYIRGVTFTSKREHARAIADYSEAIKYNKDYPLAFNKRGQEYKANGDFDKAIADFEELKRLNWDNNKVNDFLADAYMERGQSYDMKGDHAHAISDFEMVLKYRPDDGTARELLEMAKAEVGNNGH